MGAALGKQPLGFAFLEAAGPFRLAGQLDDRLGAALERRGVHVADPDRPVEHRAQAPEAPVGGDGPARASDAVRVLDDAWRQQGRPQQLQGTRHHSEFTALPRSIQPADFARHDEGPWHPSTDVLEVGGAHFATRRRTIRPIVCAAKRVECEPWPPFTWLRRGILCFAVPRQRS